MSTEASVDIAALVGAMEAPQCESIGHSNQPQFHSDGPAEAYVEVACEQCDYTTIKAYCGPLVTWIGAGGVTRCPNCASVFSAAKIIGPVNS